MHFPLPPHKAEEHSRSSELWLQVGLEVSLWLLSPRMLNNSTSYIFPYFLVGPIFTSQVSLCPLNLPASFMWVGFAFVKWTSLWLLALPSLAPCVIGLSSCHWLHGQPAFFSAFLIKNGWHQGLCSNERGTMKLWRIWGIKLISKF